MRIAQIVPSLESRHGGPSISVPKLSRALSDLGNSVELLSTGEGTSPDFPQAKTYPRDLPGFLCVSKGLEDHLGKAQYDLLHAHALWLRPLHYAHQRAKKLKVPLVVSPRGMMTPWAWNHHRWKKALAQALIHPGVLKAAQGFHATSAEEAADIRELGFKQPICVAPNGVELPGAEEREASLRHWRAQCVETANRPTALFYSRFHRKKRVLELIDLWASTAPKHWLLLIVGIPQEYTVCQLEDYVLRNSAGDRILVYDGSAQPPPYAVASLFLLPSHSENFGLVIAEALAWGLPVLVTDTTPWKAINETDFGWCGPWQQYKDALQASLSLGPEILRQRGSQAQIWAGREYSWERPARKLADFYTSLLPS